MKLAAIYNLWDGQELLIGSIQQIRKHVDVVIVLWQKESNRGNINPELIPFLESLQELNLVDHFEQFMPDKKHSLLINETKKRNTGLQVARLYDCTHYLMMDTDEYYFQDQFEIAKNIIRKFDYRNTFCSIASYFLKPTWRLTPDETYLVPFIQRLDKEVTVGAMNKELPFVVDPSRKPTTYGKAWHIFDANDLQMHHYTWVRNDLAMKLRNSSANDAPGFRNSVEELIKQCEQFKKHPTGKTPWYNEHTLTEVNNYFYINIQ